MELNWNQIDDKWRSKWHDAKDFETDPNDKPKKFIQSHIHIQTHLNILDMEEHTH